MKRCLLLAGAFCIACASNRFPAESKEDVNLVPANGLIEFGIDKSGGVMEVEFHTKAERLPPDILVAAEREIPGGTILDCEKEWCGRKVRWEVTKKVGGKEMEVLFDEKCNVVSWEIEVDAREVPANVLATADGAAPGTRKKVEEIRDGKKKLLAYHMKKEDRGIRYKIAVSPDGKLKGVWRETNAEIEVPVR